MRTVIAVKSGGLRNFFKNIFSVGFTRCISTMDSNSALSDDSVASTEHYLRLKKVQEFIPKLMPDLYKGQCGRVGVVGGSFEYTGAPYFAAITSLKVGVDLVHVFCCREAGPVIKSYSPELIVHPFLDCKDVVQKIARWLEKLHALVIGPGLGRDEDILENVKDIITHCKKNMKTPPPLIIDADGLYLINEDLHLIKGYNGPVILTPNVGEFSRLSAKMGEDDPLKMASTLNAILVKKGPNDVILNGIHNGKFNHLPDDLIHVCDVPGSNRRCGGQGDVLAGCVAAFAAWLHIQLSQTSFHFNCTESSDEKLNKLQWFRETFLRYSWAVYGACVITRTCSRLAFEEKGRGMTASDMIPNVGRAFKLHFGM